MTQGSQAVFISALLMLANVVSRRVAVTVAIAVAVAVTVAVTACRYPSPLPSHRREAGRPALPARPATLLTALLPCCRWAPPSPSASCGTSGTSTRGGGDGARSVLSRDISARRGGRWETRTSERGSDRGGGAPGDGGGDGGGSERGSNAESRGAAQRRGHGRGDAGVDARGELGILFALDDVAGFEREISASAHGAGNSGYFRPKKRSATLRDPEGAHCSTRARSPREPASRRPWCL